MNQQQIILTRVEENLLLILERLDRVEFLIERLVEILDPKEQVSL